MWGVCLCVTFGLLVSVQNIIQTAALAFRLTLSHTLDMLFNEALGSHLHQSNLFIVFVFYSLSTHYLSFLNSLYYFLSSNLCFYSNMSMLMVVHSDLHTIPTTVLLFFFHQKSKQGGKNTDRFLSGHLCPFIFISPYLCFPFLPLTCFSCF